jgi:hypothetical protein
MQTGKHRHYKSDRQVQAVDSKLSGYYADKYLPVEHYEVASIPLFYCHLLILHLSFLIKCAGLHKNFLDVMTVNIV